MSAAKNLFKDIEKWGDKHAKMKSVTGGGTLEFVGMWGDKENDNDYVENDCKCCCCLCCYRLCCCD